MKTIAFMNPAVGVGTTSLVYHLAWTFADLGINVVAVDLDPQGHLTRRFLDDETFDALHQNGRTAFGALSASLASSHSEVRPHVEEPIPGLGLLAGALALNRVSDELSQHWRDGLDGIASAFGALDAPHRIFQAAAERVAARAVLVDLGTAPSPLVRAALLAADGVIIPLGPDLPSLRGLREAGVLLAEVRQGWLRRRRHAPPNVPIPAGELCPLGYILFQRQVRFDRPPVAHLRCFQAIPAAYRTAMLGPQSDDAEDRDGHRIATLGAYTLLEPMAAEARKPLFDLAPADGVLDSHAKAVTACRLEYIALARTIAKRAGISLEVGA